MGMLRLDGHVHSFKWNADPADLLRKMEAGGVHGGSVISLPPPGSHDAMDTGSGRERLQEVLRVTHDAPDRLFPILWVHPDEPDVMSLVEEAAEKGICGFKMICSDYYVYEDRCMRLLEKIASLGKPVMFHSGILWDGKVSSAMNKPINWECCLQVPDLRFSLAHCSWPWTDECIALYGKFLNAYGMNDRLKTELFLDLTPGTPPIYRKELLTRLHRVGYDIKNNLFFGTDGRTDDYCSAWTAEWIDRDDGIYDELELDEETRSLTYSGNLMRFLGLSGEKVQHRTLSFDGR